MERHFSSTRPGGAKDPENPVAAVTHPNPYPYYRRLAVDRPLAFHAPLGMWVAADASSREAVLASPQCLVRPLAGCVPPAIAGTVAGELWSRWARMSEGGQHAERRARLERALARVPLAGIRPSAEIVAQQMLPSAVSSVSGMALDEYVTRMPPLVLACALGIEPPGDPVWADYLLAFGRGIAPEADEAVRRAGEAAARSLVARFEGRAGDDLTVADLIALLWQSADATAGGIGNTLVALARAPEMREQLLREPAALEDRVREVLGSDPPVHNTRRYVADGARIAGVTVPAGDTILVVLASRNAELLRVPPTFGHGRHGCPGDAIAVEIMTAAIRPLLARGLDWARLAAPDYRPSLNVRIPRFAGRLP